MKIAITSTGNTLDAKLDMRFGRCAYFIIFDNESKAVEIIPNSFNHLEEGSGQAAVQLLVQRNVSKIVSGEFGLKIKPILDSLKVQMIVFKEPMKKISEIINLLNQ